MTLPKSPIIPFHDKIVVTPADRETATRGGLMLPAMAFDKDHIKFGQVLAIGPGRTSPDGSVTPITVEVGDMVYFRSFSANDVKIAGEQYYIIPDQDVLGKQAM